MESKLSLFDWYEQEYDVHNPKETLRNMLLTEAHDGTCEDHTCSLCILEAVLGEYYEYYNN